jgi:hypothetical protein
MTALIASLADGIVAKGGWTIEGRQQCASQRHALYWLA